MAFSLLHQNLNFLKPLKPPSAASPSPSTSTTIQCGAGPRSQRGPLVKGRILSIEAIQAVQTLKRLQRTNPPNLNLQVSKTLSRLLKSDLLALLKELLRQNQCSLSLLAFSAVRSEYHADLTLYAEMIKALARNGMADDVDRLILEMEMDGGDDEKGLAELIKAVVGAGRRESTVRIYEMMKRRGWGVGDEYVGKVLSNGFRSFGEVGLADEVERECKKSFDKLFRDSMDKSILL